MFGLTLKDISLLESVLGVVFKEKKILEESLTHRSYINEHPKRGLNHNERLEFLGDAVLELVVTEYLYKKYDKPEGELTNWRASLVNAEMLGDLAYELGIDRFIMVSRGEHRDNGKARHYILADALEAIIGAMYLDQGYEKCQNFITKYLLIKLSGIIKNKLYRDSKSLFQEASQDKLSITPSYYVLREWGPDHAKRFEIGLFLEEEQIAIGEGSSKQEAEQDAAKKGLVVKGW
ncbi:MAG: ribonuclease III [Parcubacteria group bacterium GW2011_GWA2_38_13b]|nr:MAG: ribonuclease III [Parcubacteria group bacterium GW2011_GWA2_38_13b]